MKEIHKLTLVVAILITVLLFAHDYMYDVPSAPYTWWQHVAEAIVIGPFYVLLIWGVQLGVCHTLLGIRHGIKKLIR